MSLTSRNAKEYRKYDCHKIYLSDLFGIFCLYVILASYIQRNIEYAIYLEKRRVVTIAMISTNIFLCD